MDAAPEDLYATWTAEPDVLAGFVRSAGLRAVQLATLDLSPPWGVGPTLVGGPVLHFVRSGEAFVHLPNARQALRLQAGDVLLLPRAHGVTLSDADADAAPPDRTARLDPNRAYCAARIGSGEPTARLTCCIYHLARTPASAPLLSFLPPNIVIRRGEATDKVSSALGSLVNELTSQRLGSGGIVARLAEVILLRILREHFDQAKPEGAGILVAIADPQIGRALQAIHESLATPWTVASLAAKIGMSRAAFADLFTRRAGVSPMRYLQTYRMQDAVRLVETTDLNLAEIGRRVGYCDPTAFSRAFRRHTGRSARELRQAIGHDDER